MVGEPKSVSTVESGDNMATLPVSKAHTSSGDSIEKNNAANKEMELKNVMPNPSQRLIITQFFFPFFLEKGLPLEKPENPFFFIEEKISRKSTLRTIVPRKLEFI